MCINSGVYGTERGCEEKRGGGLIPRSSSPDSTMFWCRKPRSPKILDLNLASQVVLKVGFVKFKG